MTLMLEASVSMKTSLWDEAKDKAVLAAIRGDGDQ
jgi:hypothetical protein